MFYYTDKISVYIRLMRLDKPIGILLLLWPTLWALFLAAKGMPDWRTLLIFVLGVVVMRSAGCVINDYADRKIDGKVKRTSQRPLATDEVSEQETKYLFLFLIFLAFLLVLQLNIYTIGLSVVAAILAFIYPFMKRYTHLPQMFLGAAFGWAIPMAYAAVSQSLPPECWLLFLANLAWTVAYDTQYAMVDRDDDLRIGVKSSAILFGRYDRKMIAFLQLTAVIILAVLGKALNLASSYFILLALSTICFWYQSKLTKNRSREGCFQAFLNNNYVGMGIFVAILAGLFS